MLPYYSSGILQITAKSKLSIQINLDNVVVVAAAASVLIKML